MKRILLGLVAATAFSGCINVFSPFDSPGDDTQYLSAARAYFNSGDFVNAKKNYDKLSASDADIKNSEEALLILAQNNAGMPQFASAFGTNFSKPGAGVTTVANDLISGAKPSPTLRDTLFGAYKQAIAVTDPNLQGLGQFLTASAILAELFAEGAVQDSNSTFTAADFVLNSVACKASGACAGDANCASNANGTFPAGTFPNNGFNNASTTTITTPDIQPSLSLINEAINEMNNGLTALKLGGSSVGGFSSQFLGVSVVSNCYRQTLLNAGVGGNGS